MTEVWGLLEKAQDNNQTIDEAIAAAITAHEADADAHLGSGESLEAHKTSEVIDHLAESVVADKFSKMLFSNNYFVLPFVSLDVFDIVAASFDLFFGSCRILTSQVLNNEATIGAKEGGPLFTSFTQDPYFEVQALFSSESASSNLRDGFLGWGTDGDDISGFKIVDNVLYAYSLDYATGLSTSVEISDINVSNWHNYAVHHISGEHVYFYVDGVLKATISTNVDAESQALVLWARVKTKTNGKYASLTLGPYVFSPNL